MPKYGQCYVITFMNNKLLLVTWSNQLPGRHDVTKMARFDVRPGRLQAASLPRGPVIPDGPIRPRLKVSWHAPIVNFNVMFDLEMNEWKQFLVRFTTLGRQRKIWEMDQANLVSRWQNDNGKLHLAKLQKLFLINDRIRLTRMNHPTSSPTCWYGNDR
jgi:hypothetical protein